MVKADGTLDWTIPRKDSYTVMAGDTTYFSLGNDCDVVKSKYNITDEDMFDLFNVPALDDAYNANKEIRFSHDPTAYGDCALKNSQKWYEKADFDIFCKELQQQLELRIPDKFLEAYGWK
ncbi:hypothetical protein ACJDT4_16225 [Clostridium neuense]|uniref:Uncharacterized protein n=1 Tax=Clostridium neuense TaxID=1728934 RepID=A0ABW8THK5_9CLOT